MTCITKVCSKCATEKPLTDYRFAKFGKMGRSAECKQCAMKRQGLFSTWSQERKERKRKSKEVLRRKAGVRPMSEIQAEARTKSGMTDLWEKNAKQAFDYWLRVRATDSQARAYWGVVGRPWLNPRLTDAEQYRLKYALDLEFQVNERMRRQVRKAKNRDGIGSVMREAIVRGGASRKVERELGYSIAELMRHIEKQFTKRMTWQKFRAGEIHIDHIIPQASFDLADDDEWRRCWCLSNLRPMSARENIAKGAKVVTLC